MNKTYVLKVGLAFTLLYAAISALIMPLAWIGFVPAWIVSFTHLSASFILTAHSVVEIVLGLLLLLPGKQQLVSWLIALDLLAIVLMNGFGSGVFSVTFRDVGLIAIAVYLGII